MFFCCNMFCHCCEKRKPLTPFFMKPLFVYLFFMLYACVSFSQEKQVAVDSKGHIMFLDKETCRNLHLFDEYLDLSAVRLFLLEDSTYAQEVFYFKNDSLYKDRKILSYADVVEFRLIVDAQVDLYRENMPPNQEGRSRLLMGSSLVCAAYYSWTVPFIFEVGEDRFFVGLMMLSAGSSIYGSFALTRDIPVSRASAYMCWYGQSRGIASGLLTPWLFAENVNERLHVALGALESAGFAYYGYRWANETNMHIGKALSLGAYGDLGALLGIATSHGVGAFQLKEEHALAWGAFVGAATGIVAGNFLTNKAFYSAGDAYMLKASAVLGAGVPFTAMLLFEADNERWYSSAAALGGVGGLAFGHYLAKRVNYSPEQGIYICLSEIGGGLVGLGTGYLLFSGFNNSFKPIAVSTLLGGAFGFASMAAFFDERNAKKEKKSAFDFNVNLNGFLSVMRDPVGFNELRSVPLFSASLKF